MQAVANASYNHIKQEQKTQILPSSIQLNGCDIPLSTSVQNLGVTLEQTFSFQKYVSGTCQAWNSSNHPYLSHDALKILICAFILSHTDYCNSLLTGCPKNLVCKLQNNAARLISHSARSDHISLILCASIISFLSNPAFSTKLLFLPINHWATKPLPIYLISSTMFHLANSIHLLYDTPFLCLSSSIRSPHLLIDAPSSVKHHYSGTIYPTLP